MGSFRKSKLEEEDQDEYSDPEISESEEESESDDGEDVRLKEPAKNAIYNKEGLLDKLGDISWPENVDWINKLSVDIDQGEEEVDVNDDLARELAFYTQALEGTRQAYGKLQSMGIPFLRPEDYYAEMVKSDAHMVKVKGRLLEEKKQIQESEERRKAREAKKISKEVQAEKQKERIKEKKESIESVKKWRKQRQQSGFAPGNKDEMNLPFEDGNTFQRPGTKRAGISPGDRSGGRGGKKFGEKGGSGGGKMKSREKRDKKFGFGGRKGGNKQNTAETTNDMRGFNNRSGPGGNKKRKMK